MTAAYIAFLIMVGTTPVLAFVDSTLVLGLAAVYSATLLALLAAAIGPGAAAHILKLIRKPAILAALPLAWLIIQLLPISMGGVSRSIWESAAAGLGQPLWSHITIDLGLTLMAICRYILIIGIATLAIALTIDRKNAERFFWLVGRITIVMSVTLAIQSLAEFAIPEWEGSGGARAAFIVGSAFGVVWWTAASIQVVEQFEVGGNSGNIRSHLLQPLGATLGLTAASVSALLFAHANYAVLAGLCGSFVVSMIYCVRRAGLGFRVALAIGFIGAVAVATIIWTKGQPAATAGVAQRYAVHANGELISVANRIATEVGLAGSGAGTFASIYRLYGAPDKLGGPVRAPTFTSQITIETGQYTLWAFVLLAGGLILLLVRGAFDRGRDFLYPAAGAGVGIVAVLTSFCDASLANLSISILLAGTLGLAIAQTVSRTH